jgi:hypothetical protein
MIQKNEYTRKIRQHVTTVVTTVPGQLVLVPLIVLIMLSSGRMRNCHLKMGQFKDKDSSIGQ